MEQLILIKTQQALNQLQEYIKDKDFLSFDVETTGLTKDSKMIGFSICADVDLAYYVVLAYWDKDKQQLIHLDLDPVETFKSLMGKNLIAHNAIFDCSVIERCFGVSLIESVHTDTLILGHILDENRSNGLKELGTTFFGEQAKEEQEKMKASVTANGGLLTKKQYELYKGDADLIGLYGAKDTILTLKLFYELIPQLYEQGLDTFFYEEESMPLLKGPTYQLNTAGLKVDHEKLARLKGTLETEILEGKSFIYQEITPFVKEKYKGTGKTNTFNIGSSKQLAWLMFVKLENDFVGLTKEGRNLAKALGLKPTYTRKARLEFLRAVTAAKGTIYQPEGWDYKKKKKISAKKVGDAWNYIACGKDTLKVYSNKYKFVEKLLEYSKNLKLLNTYVEGIQSRMRYNIISPSFLQHGTTSGRYSSRDPNFQNLPRTEKRVKNCIISRPGMSFVGADYSQLEPRVFASFSNDERLLNCFSSGDDFYSVIGAEVFDIVGCSLKKDDNDPECFAMKYPKYRDIAKAVALSATYGTTAPKMALTIGKPIDEAQEVITEYFEKFTKVKQLMLDSHEIAKEQGQVVNLFGRPRRMPKAKEISQIYGNKKHSDLPYEARNILNLAINHRIQSTGASIVNRATIAFYNMCKNMGWDNVKIVMQIHDEIIVECPDEIAEDVATLLKEAMENTVSLPGVALKADPKIAKDLASLK